MSHPNPHLAYRSDIDGLRAVAVLSVVLYHAFPALLPGGFVGVDIFFVISGYLISSIVFKALAGGEFSFADFYVRRVRRIFPALLLVIVVSLAIGWSVLLPDEYAQLGKHAMAGLGFVANLVYWQEAGYFDTAAELKPLLHLWSLGVEEQFYIVWPVVAVLAWRLGRRFWLVLAGLLALSFVVNVVFTPLAPVASYFLLPARAWELLAGAALAYRVHRSGPVFANGRLADLTALLGLGLILAALLLVDKHRAFPGWWALLPVGGAVLLIAVGDAAAINRSVLSSRLAVWVGLISFPLYLWHWPLLSFVRIVSGDAVSHGALLAAVALAAACAWFSYRLVETPVRRGGSWRTVAVLVTLSLLVMGSAGNILVRDGLGFRLKDAQAKREAQALDWHAGLKAGPDCAPHLPAALHGQCLIADPARPPTAMIIGDSHANHYYWGLSESLRQQGVNLAQLADGGCVPLYGMSILKEGRLNDCRKVVNAAIDHVVANPAIGTVFLGGRWMAYASGRELRDPVDYVSDETLVLPDRSDSAEMSRAQVFEAALDETLRRLTAAGKRVVFLHAVPELPFNARECVAWNPNRFVSRTPRPDCRVSRAQSDARGEEFRPLLARILAKYPQVAVFDPVPLMCDAVACYGRRDGMLLYRDDDHLSLDGSYWLGRRMAAQLPDLLGGEAQRAGLGAGARGL